MAEIPYSYAQFSADLTRFGFASAEAFTVRGLAARHRSRMATAHPDKHGGDDREASALNAARDRLKAWDQGGRPRLVGQPEPQPGFSDTAAAAAERAAARDREAKERAEAAARQAAKAAADQAAARKALARIFFWRRWKRRALWPLRLAWRGFVNMPLERMPWAAAAVIFLLGWPFVQTSALGPYVPHFPSVYAWIWNTDAMRSMRGADTVHWANPRRY